MAEFIVTDPSGKEFVITAPEGATQEQALEYAKQKFSAPAANTPWSTVGQQALINAPSSAAHLVEGVASAIAHPIDTASGVLDIAAGGLQNMLPKGVVDFINKKFPSASAQEAQDKAAAVGKFYVDRYGSMEGFKQALAKDPVGVMADGVTLLSGGAGLAKAANLPRVSEALTTASRAIDPVLQGTKLAAKAGKITGTGLSEIIGGMGTHTGGESIRRMAQAGFEGGDKARTAAAMMRDSGEIGDLLADAQNALNRIKQVRSSAYTKSMQNVSKDKTILSFTDVDTAVNNALSVKKFKGKSISPSTTKIQDELLAVVDDWKKQNPVDFHTAEGLDALKQSIGDIRDATEFGTPSRKVADMVYNSVKSEIVKQAPEYSKIMKNYSEASELISEIQRHLLGKDHGSPITATRKLQSLLSASGKNKSLEMNLIKQLEKAGAPNLMAGLSGISLQGVAPRGLAGQAGIGLGGLGIITGNPMLGVPYLAMQSPRLMGETALLSGKVAGALGGARKAGQGMLGRMVGKNPIDNYLYQMTMLNEQGSPK